MYGYGVKFRTRFIGVQGRNDGISHFCDHCSPEAQNWTNRPAHHHLRVVHNDYPLAPEHVIAQRVDVGSACVDIRQSPKTSVLIILDVE